MDRAFLWATFHMGHEPDKNRADKAAEHSKLKELETTVGAEKSLWHFTVSMKGTLPIPEGRKILSPEIGNLGLRILQTKPRQTNPFAFPVGISPFMIPAQTPLPCQVFTKW